MIENSNICQKIDHTLLTSSATSLDIDILCQEAKKYNFYSVCINPSWLNNVKTILNTSSVKLCTVIGFPLGSSSTSSKLHEVDFAFNNGADEIDVVMNIGFFKDKNYKYINNEITQVVKNSKNKIVKVIIEAGVLNSFEIKIASKIVEDNGADFVKTSTGFSKFGASTKIIKIIKSVLNSGTKIKASGGIKSLNQLDQLIKLGVDRFGTSSSVIIMNEINNK